MLTIGPDHAMLVVQGDALFSDVTESMRSLLQVCRLNNLPGALILSHQSGFDFRSSVRNALRFAAARPTPLPRIRLALVALAADDGILRAVVEVAREVGLDCRGFRDETRAKSWLSGGGGLT